ncbi:hypothetical protein Agub_g14710, partial [Astrephomene gubernaculifera]
MVLSSTSVNRKLPSTKSISSRTAVHGSAAFPPVVGPTIGSPPPGCSRVPSCAASNLVSAFVACSFSFNSGCLAPEAQSHFPASKGGPGRTSLVAAAASAGESARGSGFGAAGSGNRGGVGFGSPRFRTFGLGGGVKRGQGRRQSSSSAAAGEEVLLSPGSSEAARTCGLGPGTVSRLQADCIRAVHTWCKLGPGDHLAVQVTHQQAATSAATPALLISAATCFAGPDGRRHALIALSLLAAEVPPSAPSPPTHHSATSGFGREDNSGTASNSNDTSNGALADTLTADATAPSTAAPAPAATTASPALSSSPMLEPYEGLEAHWGCCQGPGQRWYGGPPGWHTLPAVSHDAGHGAWQTPFVVRQAVPLTIEEAVQQQDGQNRPEARSSRAGGGPWVAVYSLMLQLPWEGPIRQGGVSFVLKAAGNVWIKARPSAADGGSSNIMHSGGSETDFWVGTSDLPLAASGRPLLPDAFRTGNPDKNLPLVFPSQPAGRPSDGSAAAAMAAAAPEATSSATSNTAGLTATAATARPTISYSNAGSQPAAIAAKLQEPHHQSHIRRHKQSDKQPAGRQAEAGTPGSREKGGGGAENQDLLGVAAAFVPPPRRSNELLRPAQHWPLPSNRPMGQAGEADASASAAAAARQWLVDLVAQREPGAERSLMHR